MSRYTLVCCFFIFLMIRRPPRSTQSRSSAASDVYKRQQKNDEVTYGKGNAPQEVAQTVFGAITDNDPGKDNAKYNCNDDSCVGRVGKVKHRPAEQFFAGCSFRVCHLPLREMRMIFIQSANFQPAAQKNPAQSWLTFPMQRLHFCRKHQQ